MSAGDDFFEMMRFTPTAAARIFGDRPVEIHDGVSVSWTDAVSLYYDGLLYGNRYVESAPDAPEGVTHRRIEPQRVIGRGTDGREQTTTRRPPATLSAPDSDTPEP